MTRLAYAEQQAQSLSALRTLLESAHFAQVAVVVLEVPVSTSSSILISFEVSILPLN